MNMLTLLTQELKSLCVFHVYLLDLIVEQGAYNHGSDRIRC